MIEIINTFSFVKENNFNSSAPILFTCETVRDFEPYWIKYVLSENQFDCLVYEIVCQRLAGYFGLSVPDIALANIIEKSFDPNNLSKNREFLQPNTVAFASKNLDVKHYMLSKLETIPDKNVFNNYRNPFDFIKIALFDLHVDNRDRTEDNFNILLTNIKPFDLYVIDHFDCFGDRDKVGVFNPRIPFNINQTIIRSSICLQAIQYLDFQAVAAMIEQYIYLCSPNSLEQIVDRVFEDIPETWELSVSLCDRIKTFITDRSRLNKIVDELTDFLRFHKRK